jgi:dienelactone hydrolase
MEFGDEKEQGGVRHRSFRLHRGKREIPGALWTPSEAPGLPLPLVLIGHGASGSRYQDYVRSLGRGLARDFSMAAAAIDGPVHGARRKDGAKEGQRSFLDFAASWSSDPSLTDEMVADWQATLDELTGLEELGGPVGYWGLSMGTILGLPFVAAEKRIEAAVLGLMGLTGPTLGRIEADAPRVSCPVLFIVQWSDELFSRQSCFDLFEALGTSDKTLHANPGGHGAVPSHEFAASARFLARRLGEDRSSKGG